MIEQLNSSGGEISKRRAIRLEGANSPPPRDPHGGIEGEEAARVVSRFESWPLHSCQRDNKPGSRIGVRGYPAQTREGL